jgi:dolichol-phosphate mannosyltransferase
MAGCAPTRSAIVVVACYNTAGATQELLERFPTERDYDLLFVDDGSTDGTQQCLESGGWPVLRHAKNRGLGAAIRSGIHRARSEGFVAMAIMAGNGKDDPAEANRLLRPILEGSCDYVQGSRFAPGGRTMNLPLIRHMLVRLHALLVRAFTGFAASDMANGFRAYRLSIFDDRRINLDQPWLDGYELEGYLYYKVLALGYRVCEVPVSKTYPPRGTRYSHVRPVVDWWRALSPLLYLRLGLRS